MSSELARLAALMRTPCVSNMVVPRHLLQPSKSDIAVGYAKRQTRIKWQGSKGSDRIIPALRMLNGANHYVRPLVRLHIQYCSHNKCSLALIEFMRAGLKSIALETPEVEFVVEPRWGCRPLFRAFYLTGYMKTVDLGGKAVEEIQRNWEMLRDASGRKDRRFRMGVESSTKSIRESWSPFHSKYANPLYKQRQQKLKPDTEFT